MTVTFTSVQAQAALDNLGKVMADALSSLPTSAEIATVSTDFGTEITRILALTDTIAEPNLADAWTQDQRSTALGRLPAGRLMKYLNTLTYANMLTNGPFRACDALDFICVESGSASLAAFLTANSILVDQYTADIFNAYVVAVNSGAYQRIYTSQVPATIPSSSVFPHSNVDYINQLTMTGASTGTLVTGSASLAALTGGNTIPGGGVLEAYAGSAIGASAYTITVTYTNIAGTTGLTVTFTIPNNATLNTVFTPGGTYNVASIQSVAVTTGSATSGDIINFRLKPVRTIAA